ncbi:hypothetical protein QWA68_005292 [Fusarium oxysporum]|nr:hypothetical protein QWA68_005292 [Fusarium oxysporum]
MTTAQVLPGIKLLRSIPSPNYRLYSSTTQILRQHTKDHPQENRNRPRQSPNRNGTKGRPKPLRIFIPPSNDHVLPSGKLLTTPEVWSFLQETGIDEGTIQLPYSILASIYTTPFPPATFKAWNSPDVARNHEQLPTQVGRGASLDIYNMQGRKQ